MVVYFPVLRWKLGERGALANLSEEVKNKIIPIIEFLGCEYNDTRFTNFCNSAVSDWGIERPIYLDLSTVDYDQAPIRNSHPALVLLRTARQQQLSVIPVLSTDINPDLFNAIKQAHMESPFVNIALRITEDEDINATINVNNMLRELNINNIDVDLIVDMRDISNGHVRGRIRIFNDLINQFGIDYHRIILLSGAFPSELGEYIGTDQHGFIFRYDWQLWNQARRLPNLRNILFGDYTTIPYEFREVPYQGAPKIKYTLEDQWFIIKGHRSRGRDHQRQDLSLYITRTPFFRGAEHSFGEARIQQCANGEWGPGNPTNWVTNDINQHITFVASQVSAILAAP